MIFQTFEHTGNRQDVAALDKVIIVQDNAGIWRRCGEGRLTISVVNKAYPESDLTSRIIACALEVHKVLGNGFQEVIYQRAMAIEMDRAGLQFSREHEMQIYYKGHDIGTRRVDFFVSNIVMVELKAIIQLEDVHVAQAVNYLEAYGLEVGLLLNFGAKSLEIKRAMKKRAS